MTEVKFLPTPQAPAAPGFALSGQLPLGSVALVFGAPGSGKTSFVVDRFRFLANELGGTVASAAAQVLVFAATRESASSLRDQLVLALGDGAAVEGSLARTISSLAFGLVRNHAIATGGRVPELISGAEQDSLIQRILASAEAAEIAWPEHIGEVTRSLSGFRSEIRNLISACQEYGLDSRALAELDPSRFEWVCAARVFAMYEDALASAEYEGRFDSPSLINRAIQLLVDGEHVPVWREIIIDDAQELTPAAARLVAALASGSAGLTLVADPDATTLGFRQSDPRIATSLASRLAGERGRVAITEYLPQRSRPVDVGQLMERVSRLIPAEGAGRQRRGLAASAGEAPAGGLQHVVLNGQQSEAEWLAFQLREARVLQGVSWKQMAVVARTRKQLEDLERMLAVDGVPARIAGAQKPLRGEYASRELMELARSCFADRAQDAQSIDRLLRSPFCGLDSIGLRRFRRALRRAEAEAGQAESGPSQSERTSDQLLEEAFANPDSLATIRGSEAARVRRFLKSLAEARLLAQKPETTIEDLLWTLWDTSGLSKSWSVLSRGIGEVAVQANRNLDAIVELFAAANRFAERNPGGSPLRFLEAQLEQNVPEDTLAVTPGQDFVALLTPAALVGRRFEIVAIASLIEGIWPNLKPRNSLLGANQLVARLSNRVDEKGNSVASEMADELRMFYKAVGAANSRVIVSSYLDEDEQVSQFLSHASGSGIPAATPWRTPALTLRGLTGLNRRRLASSTRREDQIEAAANLARLAEAGVAGAHPDDWYGLLEPSSTEPLFEFVQHDTVAIEGAEDGGEASGAAPDERYADSGERILVRPSQLEAFVKCPLHWFLNYHGGSTSDFAASVGTLVHRAMELATSASEESLWKEVESSWHTLQFESAWIEQAERRKARKLVANLAK
ncbi:MAG: UvrD-helicase domain-containing protein, partial [Micrococcales bacterium]